MYGYGMGNNLLSGLSLGKIIGGLNKTLGLINQALPLYNQLKPIIKNGKSLMSIVSIMNRPDNNTKANNNNNTIAKANNNNSLKIETKKVSNNNLPTFFQ
jgi:hypothetical protein